MSDKKKKRKDLYYEEDTEGVDFVSIALDSIRPETEEVAS